MPFQGVHTNSVKNSGTFPGYFQDKIANSWSKKQKNPT